MRSLPIIVRVTRDVLYWYKSTKTDATHVRSLPIIVRVTRDVLKGVEYLHAIRSLKEP